MTEPGRGSGLAAQPSLQGKLLRAGTSGLPKLPSQLSGSQWTSEAALWEGAAQQALPPPNAPASSRWRRARIALLAVGAALLLAGVITLLVLLKQGKLSGGGDGSGSASGAADDYSPLPYLPRQRNATVQPAFQAELHPYLLPAEVTASGLPALAADVIVVGAGVAGLAAASVLSRNLSVLVLEARVSWGAGMLCSTVLNPQGALPGSPYTALARTTTSTPTGAGPGCARRRRSVCTRAAACPPLRATLRLPLPGPSGWAHPQRALRAGGLYHSRDGRAVHLGL